METSGGSSGLTLSREFLHYVENLREDERVRTCLQCGTCSGICPLGPWMALTPRRMVAALRNRTYDELLCSDYAWMCVSCCACTHACPQEIPLTTDILSKVKEALILAGEVPQELQIALRNSQHYGNSMGESPRKRAHWAKGFSPNVTIMNQARRRVDVLWFVGDYASYHPRARLATRALARVLQALEIDFGILGPEEVSDGDSLRLAGETALFETLAQRNGRALSNYRFDEIMTTDPHAFNALKHIYPGLGISFPVRHYTQLLAEHLPRLRPMLKREVKATIVYHDPCYLGRANGVYEEPRQLLAAIPGVQLAEMSHTRANSLCCGGGGGGMWLDGFRWEKAGIRLSEWRVHEAIRARPEAEFTTIPGHLLRAPARRKRVDLPAQRILAIACPYEAPRFEDAAKVIPEANGLLVRDIAELLAESIGEVRE